MTDRILFWMDSNLIYFGIAKFLKEKYDAQYYAITDHSKQLSSFFKKQKIMEFDKVWSYRDNVYLQGKKPDLEYLEKFEKKYNIGLWKLAYSERIFYKFNNYHKFRSEEILEIFEYECKFFEKALDEIKPDFLIIKMVDYHHSLLLCKICESKGIKILTMSPTRFANRFMITQEAGLLDATFETTYDESKNKSFKELREDIKKYSIQSIQHSKKYKSSKKTQLKASLYFFLKVCNRDYRRHVLHTGRTRFGVLKNETKLVINRYSRYKLLNKIARKKIKKDERFIYFALHSEPERGLLIPSPFYNNQLSVIENVAKSIPIGYKLYVKEHPAQGIFGWRKPSWYKELMQLPNVELIHPDVSTNELLENCSLTVSIGSTIGLEGAFFNKPGIVFTNVIYSILKSIVKIDNFMEMPKKIQSLLNTEISINDLNKYVQTIEKLSFQFDLEKIKKDILHRFYYDDFVREVDIPEIEMKKVLNDYKEEFKFLANEHMKKIDYYKNNL